MSEPLSLAIKPLTPRHREDLVKLFGERGTCGRWCMFCKLPNQEFRT